MHLGKAYKVEVTKLLKHVDTKEDPLIRIVRKYKHKLINARDSQNPQERITERNKVIKNLMLEKK